jgi:hypothetical protein
VQLWVVGVAVGVYWVVAVGVVQMQVAPQLHTSAVPPPVCHLLQEGLLLLLLLLLLLD